ncbi:MAG: hypothetical protein ABW352_16305 [Polyangiales bacterium]
MDDVALRSVREEWLRRVEAEYRASARTQAEVHRAARGTQAPCIDRKTLDLARTKGSPLEHDVLRVAAEQYRATACAAPRRLGATTCRAHVGGAA